MKAILFEKYGSPEVLQIKDIESPKLNAGQILIETKAFGINPIDWKLRSGIFKEFIPLELPYILGYEASGIIKKVADDVKNFKVGDKVYAHTIHAYAEEVILDPAYTHPIPDFLSFEQAAALASNTQVAFNALVTLGNLKAKQKVLIHAGSGGVGIAAIQIAKHLGAIVTTTVSSKNIELVKRLGADQVIDYTQTQLDDVTEKFDLILDSIGGTTQIKSWSLLNNIGSLISLIGDESAHFKHKGPEQKFILTTAVQENHSEELHQLIAQGHIKPVIDQVFDFNQIAEAHKKSESGHVAGKIVVKL